MIKFILMIFALLITSGCEQSKLEPNKYYNSDIKQPVIVLIDNCEYIQYKIKDNEYGLTHKGNCKFCKQRLKEELQRCTSCLPK